MQPEKNSLNQDSESERPELEFESDEGARLIDENVFEPTDADQELSAYLDGELGHDGTTEVEQRLHSDPDYLAKLQAFQRTWDFFDAIPVEVSDDSFVRTTMEMVITDIKTSLDKSSGNVLNRSPWKWLKRGLVIAAIPLLVVGISFAVTRKIQTTPHRTLIQNLSLIENLDRYKRVDFNLGFLEDLDQQELFTESRELTSDGLPDLTEVDSQNRNQELFSNETDFLQAESARLASMSPSKLREIQRHFEEFQKLSMEQTQNAIQFHKSLTEHPNRTRLVRTLNHYYAWLRDLNSLQTANLLDSQPEDRLKMIVSLRAEQAKAAFGRLGETKLPDERDEEHLLNWFEFTLKGNEPTIRSEFPRIYGAYLESQQRDNPNVVVKSEEELTRFARQASLQTLVSVLLRIDREVVQEIIFEHIGPLRDGLTSRAQEIIRSQPPEDQSELVMNWIAAANEAKAMIPDERLQEFYEQLPSEKRDELDQLSFDEWKNALIDMYRNRNAPKRIDDLESLFLGELF